MDTFIEILVAASIPSALTGLMVWTLKRKIEKHEKERKVAEEMREEFDVIIIEAVNSAIALGEATATALKNGHTNGETDGALEYARSVKHKQKEFLTRKGVEHIIR